MTFIYIRKKNKLKNLIFICALFVLSGVQAQTGTDRQLAEHYYANKEFDKAQNYFEVLYKYDPSKYNFTHLLDCYNATNSDKEAEKLIKKQWSQNKGDLDYPVILGQFYEDHDEVAKANDIYDELISDLRPVPSSIINLFNAFKGKGKNDYAFKAISRGRDLMKNNYPFHFQFAEYYGATQQPAKMIGEYLDLLDFNPSYLSSVQTMLTRQIDFGTSDSKELPILKEELLKRAQKNPSNTTYSELLIWLFVQTKEFNAALVQTQALDKRFDQKGYNVFNLGTICVQNKEYSVARKAFKYVKELGDSGPLYYRAENALLNTRFLEITSNRNYTETDIQEAISDYQTTIQRVGKNNMSLPLIVEMSHIQAFYGDDAETAIQNLTEALEIARLTDMQRAEVKMQLADIHVLHGDIWEASLYYMQVDKSFKFEPIGHEARFKNARIFYYDGEFNYAQSQLDVLKQSTSKLIANDAIQLSLLITDNYGLDSNFAAMFWFASADLLIEQHKYSEAFQLFDSIMINFPYHSLGDEILIKKSKAMQYQGKWNEALNFLEELLKYYSEDILADDAWFQKGDIYQNHLFDDEKAKECYLKILTDFKGSLFSTESRKRFRKLRGESVEEDSVERDDQL